MWLLKVVVDSVVFGEFCGFGYMKLVYCGGVLW